MTISVSDSFRYKIINIIEKFNIRELCDLFHIDKFHWEVKGTSLLSGTYKTQYDFYTKVLNRLERHITSNSKILVKNYYSCKQTLILELEGKMKTIDCRDYNNQYCWIIEIDGNHIISITAYLDTLLLDKILN